MITSILRVWQSLSCCKARFKAELELGAPTPYKPTEVTGLGSGAKDKEGSDYFPVLPNPPSPRSEEEENESTISSSGLMIGKKTS